MSKIEEITAETPVEEVPSEEVDGEIPEGADVTVFSRGEKKARKLLVKLGLKKVTGINRVVLKRSDDVNFVISKPDVYKAGNSYVVFGLIKVEDYSKILKQAQEMQAQGINPADVSAAGKSQEEIQADLEAAAASGEVNSNEPAPEASEEELVAAGISEEDIKMIKDQAPPSTTNGEILKAFNDNGKDLINTIVALSS